MWWRHSRGKECFRADRWVIDWGLCASTYSILEYNARKQGRATTTTRKKCQQQWPSSTQQTGTDNKNKKREEARNTQSNKEAHKHAAKKSSRSARPQDPISLPRSWCLAVCCVRPTALGALLRLSWFARFRRPTGGGTTSTGSGIRAPSWPITTGKAIKKTVSQGT